MKKIIFSALAAFAFSAAAATAQDAAPARTTTTPPAVANPNDTNRTTAAPVAGRNSFTEDQARKRFMDNGYTQVTELRKDEESSVWHAKAMKSGKAVGVTLDYQGNITTGTAGSGATGGTPTK
jgi:hypothetical protein